MTIWWLGLIVVLSEARLVHPDGCSACKNLTLCAQQQSLTIQLDGDKYECEIHEATDNKTILLNNSSISLSTTNRPFINLTNLTDVKSIHLSFNKVPSQSITVHTNARFLNLSYGQWISFSINSKSVKELDLSNNAMVNISKSQFQLPELAHLVISNNHIQSLCNFSSPNLTILDSKNNNVSQLCIDKNAKLKVLDLSNNSIIEIQSNISKYIPKLEILNLSMNSLTQLRDNSFNLPNLLKLDLSNNNIFHLSPKCFLGLSKLQLLDISHNKIVAVFPSTLQYFPGLIQLIVSDNPDLSTQDFGIASRRLKSLIAIRTNQRKIPSSLTRSVRYLSLSHNNITQIQCGDLDSYPLLNSLDLANNNMNYIEDDALGRLELLKSIVLSNNLLSSIPYALPSNLKVLLLNNNTINKISVADFSGLIQLKQLDLSNNLITSVSEGSFAQMYGLEVLNLSGNHIQIMSSSTFSGPVKMLSLDLSYLTNVTKCDQALCFPVPEPNELEELHLQHSPDLANRLINDAAALKTFTQLKYLDLSNSNISEEKNEFTNYFPRLQYLSIEGNYLNCSEITFLGSDVKQSSECSFVINDKVTTTFPNPSNLTGNGITESSISYKTMPRQMTTIIPMIPFNFVTPNLTDRNNSPDFISNEVWYAEPKMGEVDAYSAEAPSTHPGLYVLLLLPVALLLAVLFFNYSRIKRRTHIERRCEMDIEISNISSELW